MKAYPTGEKQDRQEPAGNDELVIVCMPVVNGPAIPGSTQRNCAGCAEPIWVSQATLKSVEHRKQRRFLCVPCATKDLDKGTELLKPSPEQINELTSFLTKLEDGEQP